MIQISLRSFLRTYFDELLEDTLRQRFKLEAEAWLRLGSPEYSYYAGLKRLLKVEGKLYLVMDYYPGGNLRELLVKDPLDVKTAAHYATQILLGMLSISEFGGMVHRDLKPENILFDDEGSIKISDLGIVKFLQDAAVSGGLARSKVSTGTQFGSFIGTVSYAAPEQLHRTLRGSPKAGRAS